MKKCVFIVPYFGKLPGYFPLFLRSCERNPSFDWLIITNDITEYNYPQNVRVMKSSFSDFKKLIQSKFDFQIELNSVQKLCDYKPVYGYLLEDKIANYEYWGYCDLDVIFGDLSYYLDKLLIKGYDKLFELGHLTIFKNNKLNNRLFMKPLNGKAIYKWCFKNKNVTTFDEVYGNNPDVNDIFLSYGKKVYRKNFSFDIQPGLIGFQNANYDYESQKYLYEKNYWQKVCTWENGKIYRYYITKSNLRRSQYIYVHLQDRKMSWDKRCLNCEKWLIIPNRIMPLKKKIYDRKILNLSLDLNTMIYCANRIMAKCKHIFVK